LINEQLDKENQYDKDFTRDYGLITNPKLARSVSRTQRDQIAAMSYCLCYCKNNKHKIVVCCLHFYLNGMEKIILQITNLEGRRWYYDWGYYYIYYDFEVYSGKSCGLMTVRQGYTAAKRTH
ncbi:hypothetical protein T02_16097, partial [Trichinella nativa]